VAARSFPVRHRKTPGIQPIHSSVFALAGSCSTRRELTQFSHMHKFSQAQDRSKFPDGLQVQRKTSAEQNKATLI
jgi:hypothetical protein